MKKPGQGKSQRKPTIIDVARAAHVSVMTVSRVINQNETVKPVTRAKVMSAISKVGYRPNDAARMLKGMPSRTIALILPDLSDFFSSCFHAVQEVALQHDYQTMVAATGRREEMEVAQLESVANHRVAGVLIVPSGADSSRGLKVLQQNGVPVVALDRPVPGLGIDAVLVENREGAELGVRHLIGHRYKSIACVAFEKHAYTVRERIEGYRQAMRRAGLRLQLHDSIDTQEAMEQLVARWVNAKDRPAAVFSTQRISTIRLVRALHHCRLRVPQDIAVVGFDDFELAEVLGTPLTVIAQSPADVARTAAELLFKQIERAQRNEAVEHKPAKIVFPAKLVIRASCGCTEPSA
jgi:LacI family transcriptional regulator